MIITAGRLKGRKVKCPAGMDIRPTSSKTRMGIFNVLSSNFSFSSEIRMLELFAGTGLFSFEALSRDVDSAVLVDKSQESISFIKNNISNLGLLGIAEAVKADAIRYLQDNDISCFNLIFLDPPYALDIAEGLLPLIDKKSKQATVIIIETNKTFITEGKTIGNLHAVRVKDWGEAIVSFILKN